MTEFLIWVLVLYVFPLIFNYIIVRQEIKEYDMDADWYYMVLVFVPIVNLGAAVMTLIEIIVIPDAIKLFFKLIPEKIFMIKKKRGGKER